LKAIGLHLRRTNPLPSFLQVRAELLIEELTAAKTAPATALLSSSYNGNVDAKSALSANHTASRKAGFARAENE
jgi:hypothetical protein